MQNLTPEIQDAVIEKESMPITMPWPTAMKEVKNGKKVARIVWPDTDYVVMDEGWLKVFTNGSLSKWLVNDGDVEGEDWFVLEERN